MTTYDSHVLAPSAAFNPYSPPEAKIEPSSCLDLGEASQLRQANLRQERSVTSLSILYVCWGVLGILAGGLLVLSGVLSQEGSQALITGGLSVLVGLGYFWAARELKNLRPAAKVPVLLLSGIGLLQFPVGTVINAYVLHCVFSEKSRLLFTPEYREAVRQTPEVKVGLSRFVSTMLVLVTGVVAVAIFAGIRAGIAAGFGG